MMEKSYFYSINQYIEGWKNNNLNEILACLVENCIVIESHGPTYHGIEDITKWFDYWIKADSHIERWDILSFYDLEKKNVACVEWSFSCISNKKRYAFDGMSVIKFLEQKISFIHEYRMTHKAYVWQKNQLESE